MNSRNLLGMDGDLGARDELMGCVYGDCRALPRLLRRERRDHTLQPTALVNEVYLRLVGQRRTIWQNRAQFYGVAADDAPDLVRDRARRNRPSGRDGGCGSALMNSCR